MKISELYAPHGPFVGESCCIVGSGPSLDVFPTRYLQRRQCILLNDVQRYRPTLGPIAFSNHCKFINQCKLPYQLLKARNRHEPNASRDDNHMPWENCSYYCFSYREPSFGDAYSHFDPEFLWHEPCHYWNQPGGSVSIFAIQFALLAGFKEIHLVGCDCLDLGKAKHLKAKGKTNFRHNYDAYVSGVMRLKRAAADKFDADIIQTNPFVGLGREQEQYEELLTWNRSIRMLGVEK